MKKLCLPILLTAFVLSGTSSLFAAKDISVELESYQPWSEEAVQTFEKLLIQEGGRVKPMHSFARFTLMQLNNGGTKVQFQTKDGVEHTVEAPAWLMDVLFRGDTAKHLPCFLVEDSAGVVQIGVSPKSKRDRYSYSELLPGRAKLAELTAKYGEKKQKFDQDRKTNPPLALDEQIVLQLGRNISSFEFLMGQFGFARKGKVLVNENLLPDELKKLAAKLDMAEMMDKMPEMTVDQLFQTVRQASGNTEDERLFAGAMRLFFFHASSGRGLSIFPPKEMDDKEWNAIGDVMLAGLEKKDDRPWAKEQMAKIQSLVDAAGEGDSTFTDALKTFSDGQKTLAKERGEGQQSALEVKMYHTKPFKNALAMFIVAFVVLAISWLMPGSKFGRVMFWLAIAFTVLALVMNVYGITLRCIIRSRPPVTNLYDTVIFITAVAVLLGLALEYFTRIGIGILVGILLGIIGMALSITYEAKEATDTMGKLVAVLDTNFWLTTHVITIAIGYAAGMVAALLAMIYLAGRFICTLIGKSRESRDFFKTLSRMTYGIICFCLLFSLVGTVLGGIWANDSWGRFWGWDPKENGALMICLWCLVILHARMGGYIRDLGIAMNAVVLGAIVTFSHWGVNNLGVGLHSYGFTEGIWGALYLTWTIMAVPFVMGVVLFFIGRSGKKNAGSPPAADSDNNAVAAA